MAARRALITGAGGFAGQWLSRELVRHGWDVTGSSLDGAPAHAVLSPEDHALVRWRHEDLRAPGVVRDALDASRPDAVFHLAGVSFLPAAAEDPSGALAANVGIAAQLLDEIRRRRNAGTLDPVILVVGSAEQYGRHDASAMPLHESAECRPCSFYAATKCAQEGFALAAFRSDGVRAICTRSFNHSGRGQSPSFLLPALVARVLKARAGGERSIPIGNVDVQREFNHVEDVVRAYILLVEEGLPGEVYNVCGGLGVTVEALAREVLAAANVEAELVADETLRRRVDTPNLVGAGARLREDTGWLPRFTRADIIRDLIHAAQG